MKVIQTSKVYPINDKKIKLIVFNMLHKCNHKHSSHNSNFKCIDSTIKCIIFDPIHYAINLDIVSSYMVFNNFD